MPVKIKIDLNDGLYLKDPQESKLGRKIIKFSIEVINKIGFESFNFKKLATEINSTEASLYRYFENKHLLLLYLVNWYWEWINYLIIFNTMNIEDPKKKLKIIVHSLVFATMDNSLVEFIDESKLHKIVVFEGTKAYHTFEVNKEDSIGLFKSYKDLTIIIASIISEVNPDFKYPITLASNLFEMTNNQLYFAKHLPKLTDVMNSNHEKEVENMLNYFLEKLLF
ncbi:MAG: TetR/AcrR family transcriptional regulator [Flavobacteriaceae bacterium]|nr:TetR/AcrR family transcriptional regulator [Flavobacteriaceae bacterium]